jgi:hypothetical protein
MHSSDSEQSSDDSGSADDPRQSCSVPNSLSHLHDDYDSIYESGSDSVVTCTAEKKIEEHDGLSDCSDLHTPAQPSKRLRLASVSPVKMRQISGSESDSDCVERYSLFDSTPSCKRGFKRPRQPWLLVKQGTLDE